MHRLIQQHGLEEEIEIMMASAPPSTTTVGIVRTHPSRDQLPLTQKPHVLTRSDSQAERLLLIRKLKDYSKRTTSRPAEQDDNKSLQSVRSSKSWWRGGGRSVRVDEDVKSGIPDTYSRSGQRQQSLRLKKKKNTARSYGNDQLVADFFDIKSVTSEPEFVGSKKLQLFAPHKTTVFDHETRSVSSSRSFRGFSLSFRQGSRRSGGDDEVDYDDELTMDSGLGVSGADECSVVSGITLEPPTFQRAVSEGAYLTSPKSKGKKSFLHRFFRKVRRSHRKTNPTPAEPTVNITTEIPVVLARSNQGDDEEEEEEVAFVTAVVPQARFDNCNAKQLACVDRWSPIPRSPIPQSFDDEGAPRAPKQPIRRVENSDFHPILEDESKEDEEAEDDQDDESVISLIGGLLATWTSERKLQPQVSQINGPPPPSNGPPKSCLKTSSNPSWMNGGHSTFKPRFSVTFDRIKIREYERTLGDNPSCTSGPPISIGWTYLYSHDYPIDEYERNKTARRTKREFHLTAAVRTDLLTQEWKCLEDDIRKACREATYIQYCREKSVLSRARQRAQEREAAAKHMAASSRSNQLGPRPDTSDTEQPPRAQLRHRSSVEIGLEASKRAR